MIRGLGVRGLGVADARRAVLAALMLVVGVLSAVSVGWASVLPDGRVYELVSPAQKNGSTAGSGDEGEIRYALARADGNAVLYEVLGPVGGDIKDPASNVVVSRRSPNGVWGTASVLPEPFGKVSVFADAANDLEPSADLSSALFVALGSFISEDPAHNTSSGSIYIAGEDGSSLVWVGRPTSESAMPPWNPMPPEPRLGIVNGVRLNIAGASSNLGVAFFTYYGTLVPEDEARAELLPTLVGGNFERDPGFYEWRAGRTPELVNAGKLPDGSYNEFGAEPASVPNFRRYPTEYHNQVSSNGSRAFFVSPSAEKCDIGGGCENEKPQLYVRLDGNRSVLVSRTESGAEAPDGPLYVQDPFVGAFPAFMFASPDGSRVFFESVDALTQSAEEAVSDGVVSAGSVKMYMFNTDTEKIEWLPGVSTSLEVPAARGASVVAVAAAGEPGVSGPTRALFARTGAGGGGGALALDLWIEGPDGGSVTPVASVLGGGSVRVAHVTDGGRVFVFEAGGDVAGSRSESFNNGGFEQVYRYAAGSGALECVSCPPAGVVPSGDAHLSSDDNAGIPLSGPLDSRGVSADGSRVFFDTPDPLVSEDVDGKRDVYEWENGKVSLISAGTGLLNSYFLDNSESGNDVFFSTADGLVGVDTDGGYDVYDARVGGRAEPPVVEECSTGCQGQVVPPRVFSTPTSAAFSGPGNTVTEVPPVVESTPAIKSKAKPAKKRKPAKKKQKRNGRQRKGKRRAHAKSVRGGRASVGAATGGGR